MKLRTILDYFKRDKFRPLGVGGKLNILYPIYWQACSAFTTHRAGPQILYNIIKNSIVYSTIKLEGQGGMKLEYQEMK